ncbi:peroxidasin homolog [Hyalella azteca]|uniref:Peroxidasin homolog n=1 Tax=Hyalella azteca TaxID=294128 RepID=A0A8B7PII1_HYAAZ|nr:peroxidasin homolog [Hyalella azteca]
MPTTRHVQQVLLVLQVLLLTAGAQLEQLPSALLEQALSEGFLRAQEQRQVEAILGLSTRGGVDLDVASERLFDFRRPQADAKAQSVCLGASLLEASKFLKNRLPGTTDEAVQRLQSQTLRSATCQRLLTQSGSDCAGVRVEQVPRCDPGDPYRTFDGTCNNVRNPLWGSIRRPFTRYIRPFYEDGLDEPRGAGRPPSTALPSPRMISVELSQGVSGRPKPLLAITSLVMQFGQFLDHDLTHTPESAVRGTGSALLPLGCCEGGVPPSHDDQQRVPDCRPIDLTGDRFYARLGRVCMRFVRSLVADTGCRLGPREQLNQVTSYLDGSVLYGTSQFLANHLRDPGSRGQLRTTLPAGSSPSHGSSCPRQTCNAGLLPEQRCHAQTTSTCFISGDGRANEQPGLTSLHVLFMRVHNAVAAQLASLNPGWSSDRVYQESRRVVGALLQQVVYREFLPVVLGSAPMDHFRLWLQSEGYYHGYNETVDPTTPNVFAAAAFRFGHSLVDDILMQGPSGNLTLLDSFFKSDVLKKEGTRPSQFLQSLTLESSQDPDEYMVPTLTNNLFGSARFPIGLDLYALNVMRGRDHGLAGYNHWRAACGLPTAASFTDLTAFLPRQTVEKFQRLYKRLQELRSVWLSSLLCHHTNIVELQPSPFLAPEPLRNALTSCLNYKQLDLRPWQEGFVPLIQDSPAEESAVHVPISPDTQRPPLVEPLTQRPPILAPTQSTIHSQTQNAFVTARPQVTPTVTFPQIVSSFRPPVSAVSPPVSAVRPITSTVRPPASTIWSLVSPDSTVRPPVSTGRPPLSPVRPPVSTAWPTVSTGRPQISTWWPPVSPSWPSTSVRPPTNPPSPLRPVQTRPPYQESTHRPPYQASTQRPPYQVPTHRPPSQVSTQWPSYEGSAKRPILQTQPPYYQLPPFGKQCRAVGVWRSIPGMDFWCTSNCFHPGASHCPPTHCTCY